jgi:hypothetical protein
MVSGFCMDSMLIVMYANICTTTNSIEREIAERLGMKAINDNSWFSKIRQILAIYELPSSHNILDFPLTKNCLEKDGQEKRKYLL